MNHYSCLSCSCLKKGIVDCKNKLIKIIMQFEWNVEKNTKGLFTCVTPGCTCKVFVSTFLYFHLGCIFYATQILLVWWKVQEGIDREKCSRQWRPLTVNLLHFSTGWGQQTVSVWSTEKKPTSKIFQSKWPLHLLHFFSASYRHPIG